ncbi:MAG: methyl-accepting chemotaxis protein [Gloeomargarita sp. SKYBB_i_bin120]|nr:methyl-accepting chemotaxis protein [Gloeomargarita sp. SKYG98]MCS7292807.1 methyl-accepting chemotaxis protein [Gloeomargarita sp. SKYB120]MDW8178370.1 methyl-accepting chemotaxis protein [Gloeomargarita sp. SKYBB_i_bin120]
MDSSHVPTTPEWPTDNPPDEVPATLEQAETTPDPLLQLYLQGQEAWERGEVEEARRLWQQVVAQDPQGSYGAAAQAALQALPPPLVAEPLPVPAPSFSLQRWWQRLPFRRKLAAILLVWTTVPVVVLTQIQVQSVRQTVRDKFEAGLRQGVTTLNEEYVQWLVSECQAQAQTVAQLLQRNPQLITQPNPLVQTLLTEGLATNEPAYPEMTKNLRLILDAQGQVRQQHVVVAQPDQQEMGLLEPDAALPPYRTQRVTLPADTNLGTLPWVQQALTTGELVAGLTLLASQAERRKLGIDVQARGVGLLAVAVQPVTRQGKVLGAVVVGGLLNRNHWLVDHAQRVYGWPLIGVYARDIQVTTNFPNPGDPTRRALGKLAPAAVAEALLQRGQDQQFTTLKLAGPGGRQKEYLLLFAALRDFNDQPVGLLAVGRPLQELERLLWDRTSAAYGLGLLTLLLAWGLGWWAATVLAEPVRRLSRYAKVLAQGQYQERLSLPSQDEFALLAREMSQMAAAIETQVATLQRQQQEAQAARTQLETDVIQLLTDIEGAQQGDLTVRAQAQSGPVAAIADAFNVTLASLRTLVGNVRATADRVATLAGRSEAAVVDLAQAAQSQELELTQALALAAENAQAIQAIAQSAAEAAVTAQSSLEAAQEGQQAMDATAQLYDQIREAVGKTSKKVKHLVGSSQEISQVLAIIQEISVQTNLLSFNASLEADRAGEHGQGFRLIADEIGQLANLVRKETARIEALVRNIQRDTADVSHAMESSTGAVVQGALLVQKTQQVLQRLAALSAQIAAYQDAIAQQTRNHSHVSSQVQTAMENVAAIAATTSGAAQEVAAALQELGEEVQQLQRFVQQFRL